MSPASPAQRRRKGRAAERETIGYMTYAGIEVQDCNRSGFAGADLLVPDLLSGEVKAHRSYDFGAWLRQAEADAPEGTLPAVIAKRNGTTDVGKWFFVMELSQAVELLKLAQKGQASE